MPERVRAGDTGELGCQVSHLRREGLGGRGHRDTGQWRLVVEALWTLTASGQPPVSDADQRQASLFTGMLRRCG